MEKVIMINNKTVARKKIQENLKEAFSLLREIYPGCNPMAPGFLKEEAMASILGHDVETAKHKCDAYDKDRNQMEYLTCMEAGVSKTNGKKLPRAFAIDDVKSSPEEAKKKSLKRITRNDKIYYGIFKEGVLECIELWVGCPKDLEKFVDKSVTRRGAKSNDIAHTVNIGKTWMRENCKRII
jgi:hypothetical protein